MSNEEGYVKVTRGQSTAGFIIKMIVDSEVDEYLKAIFDAVKERKFELELSGGLPGQKQVSMEAVDVSKVEHDPIVSVTVPPPTSTPTASKGTRVVSKSGAKYYAQHKPRPSADMKVFGGAISPVRIALGTNVDPNSMFGYEGYMYTKKDVIGECFTGDFDGVTLKYQVVGVGPKAVKILLIDEPPTHIVHNKKSLHTAWQSNEPVFIGHGALAPWLRRD